MEETIELITTDDYELAAKIKQHQMQIIIHAGYARAICIGAFWIACGWWLSAAVTSVCIS